MTPQRMIQFIQERYKAHKGLRAQLFSDSALSLEVKAAIKYLHSLDESIDISNNYEIFLKLISYFYSVLYRHERKNAYFVLAARLFLLPHLFDIVSLGGFYRRCNILLKHHPLQDVCGTEQTLEMALTINDSPTTNVLLDILRQQLPGANQFQVGKQLLQMKYHMFLELVVYEDEFAPEFIPSLHRDSLIFFTTHRTLTESETFCVNNSAYPFETYYCLLACSYYDLWPRLSQNEVENICSFFTCKNTDNRAQMRNLNLALGYLSRNSILTGPNIERLIAPKNSVFLTSINELNLSHIPEHMRTQESFDEMLRLSRAINPVTVINSYITRLIGGNRAGDTQSTHRRSVHASVALSLERLNQRYPLSKAEIEKKVQEFQAFKREIQKGNFNYMDEETHGDNRCSFVAIRSIDRFIALSKQWVTVKEALTQYPLKKIIALVWTGVMDTSNHRPNDKNAKAHLIQGLCESQRRYNYGNTTGGDLPTCNGGAINDIVATLDDIHLDVMIVLINPTSISDLSFTFARNIFLDKFKIEMEKDTSFMARVDAEIATKEWQSQALSDLYDNCIQETTAKVHEDINQKMQHAKFTSKLIADVSQQVAPWIQESTAILCSDKCMLEHAKRRVHSPQQTHPAQGAIKDEFEKLLSPIQTAISAYSNMRTHPKISSLFKTINVVKVDQLCRALEAKSYLDVIEWLSSEENIAELKVGVLGRYLQQAFIVEPVDDRPFSSPDLDNLSKWVEYCAIDYDIRYLPYVS